MVVTVHSLMLATVQQIATAESALPVHHHCGPGTAQKIALTRGLLVTDSLVGASFATVAADAVKAVAAMDSVAEAEASATPTEAADAVHQVAVADAVAVL